MKLNYDPQMLADFRRRGREFDPCSLAHQRYAQAWARRGGPPSAAVTYGRLLAATVWLVLSVALIPLRALAFAAVMVMPRPRTLRIPEAVTWARSLEIVRGGPPVRR